jgi:purine-nucleoside phosphorylase
MTLHEALTQAQVREAADGIGRRTSHHPQVGLVLGSGLNPLADSIHNADRIPYSDIPYFPTPSVVGHAGQLVIGELAGQTVMALQGRAHVYEGYSLQRVTFPIRVMATSGVHTLIVTNAAGGINPSFQAGDLMLIKDHIGLMAMVGGNPLWGPNDDSMGPRFPAMNQAYDLELRRLARNVADEQGISLREGVYCGLGGPTFETPAEVRFLRLIGADAVGMSTVPEVIVARHGGLRVLGFSGISNVAVDDPNADERANHEEVLAAGQAVVPKLMALICGVLTEMPPPSAATRE